MLWCIGGMFTSVSSGLWTSVMCSRAEIQVHRICFALSLFHVILSASLIGVKDTRDKRAALQNGYVLFAG